MWVEITKPALPKLTLAQIPAVDWIVQFDPPDDPRGANAFNPSCKVLLTLVRLHTSSWTNSARRMYSMPIFSFRSSLDSSDVVGAFLQSLYVSRLAIPLQSSHANFKNLM